MQLDGRDGATTPDTAAGGIVAPNVRDLGELWPRLREWLSERLGRTLSGIDNIAYPRGAGMSHETILFDAVLRDGGEAVRRPLVVRIKPGDNPVYQRDMFEAQYAVMQLMHAEAHVRVAEPLWLETDPSLLGAPFFVMAQCAGRVPISTPSYAKEGWLMEATADQRRVLWEDSVRQLAAIQLTSPARATFLSDGSGASGFDQEIAIWRRYLDWIEAVQPLPFQRAAFDRLTASLPDNRPEGIVWGDARLGNMMFGDDMRVVAVMDWEQPSLGGALHDLGWWLFSERLRTAGAGVPTPPGMGERAETVQLWEEVSGHSAADLDWYVAFAALKMACLGARMTLNRTAPGQPVELSATPLNRAVATLLDMAPPAATV